MEGLSRSYWRKHKRVLLVAGSCGFAFVGFVMSRSGHNQNWLLGFFLVQALLGSPFTLKTAAGRLWWASYVAFLVSGSAAVLLGVHHPLAWICAAVAACSYAVGVCLRWNPIGS